MVRARFGTERGGCGSGPRTRLELLEDVRYLCPATQGPGRGLRGQAVWDALISLERQAQKLVEAGSGARRCE